MSLRRQSPEPPPAVVVVVRYHHHLALIRSDLTRDKVGEYVLAQTRRGHLCTVALSSPEEDTR